MMVKGRAAAAVAAFFGLLVLGGGAYASRGLVTEWWWIWRVRSSRGAERAEAAGKLVRMKSIRVVPHLLAAIEGEPSEEPTRRTVLFGTRCSQGSFIAIGEREERSATPLVHALWQIGDPALPAIRLALSRQPSGRMRSVLEELLDRTGPPVIRTE